MSKETSQEIQELPTITSLADLKKIAKSTKKPLILKFTAVFCNPCKIMSEELKKYKGRDIALLNIDVRESADLAKHFGVRAVPYCCLVDEECEVVRDRSGLMYVDEFERFVEGIGEREL
ncbi:protein-disulfide reductase [Trachipleistophora hominis]|uniref:Protein-disulfide reductase n=1 Tax=Trachipleistophora hominis TaxID=72359 RepID=L7JTN4_TRAHO|nr:protein-disulfide reductase [Trachipleistophora hominis]